MKGNRRRHLNNDSHRQVPDHAGLEPKMGFGKELKKSVSQKIVAVVCGHSINSPETNFLLKIAVTKERVLCIPIIMRCVLIVNVQG